MLLEISNLTKVFGDKTVLDIHSFNIGNGEIVGLVGNNGAGKTTLFVPYLTLLNATAEKSPCVLKQRTNTKVMNLQ